MARTTTTVEDPTLVTTRNVDKQGRVYLGSEFKNATVRILVETMDDEPDDSAFARELSRGSIADRYGDDYFGENPDWADDLPDLGGNA
jgi:hypothetical protein